MPQYKSECVVSSFSLLLCQTKSLFEKEAFALNKIFLKLLPSLSF